MRLFQTSGLDALLQRPEQESLLRRFLRAPLTVTAQLLYQYLTHQPRSSAQPTDSALIRVVCISDTHSTQPHLPDGDILVHEGDRTQSGTKAELEAQIEWLHAQPHRHKVTGSDIDWKSLIYLQNTYTTLDCGAHGRRITIFGSPYTPKHGNWAFQYLPADTKFWDDVPIPEETDILITHGPPRTHLDLGRLGCSLLLDRLWFLRQKPLLHVFGHIHGGYGMEVLRWGGLLKLLFFGGRRVLLPGEFIWWGSQKTVMINAAAAICVDI
ncbi:hypothetical protein BO71DRAFT_452297 [Aspergillus ellipticus CBS 707.79]|uniref:Metallo-dependent phosphatase n=1 Tax=Aspergillus ellipticus CBS 707.79 TaxID=1448320 RepID=A0A319DJ01_9EURO|nr:hypothetical protein BO71DRAFT_452297 [Aspergillus ellipticus CBS 707.79]